MDRVLVIRFSSLGDIILTAPVIDGLKQLYPAVHIDYLVHRQFGGVVRCFATVPDNIVEFTENITAIRLPQFARDLAPDGYDLVIDLHDSMRSKLLRKLVKCSERRVYRKPRLNRWLLFKLHYNRFAGDFSVPRSYLNYAGLKGQNVDPRPTMHIDDAIIGATLRKFGLAEPFTVCIPGAAWPQKS